MDQTLLLTVIITVVVLVVLIPLFAVFIVIAKKSSERVKQKSKFNNIQIGMTETDLYAQFGAPKQTIEADSTTKVVTFHENKWSLLFLLYVGIEAQVSIKNGIVTNVMVSVKNN